MEKPSGLPSEMDHAFIVAIKTNVRFRLYPMMVV